MAIDLLLDAGKQSSEIGRPTMRLWYLCLHSVSPMSVCSNTVRRHKPIARVLEEKSQEEERRGKLTRSKQICAKGLLMYERMLYAL